MVDEKKEWSMIRVKPETIKLLKYIKIDNHFKTLDQAINFLIKPENAARSEKND